MLLKIKSALTTRINPVPKYDGKNKLASVLVVIYGRKPNVLMTQKSKILRFHAGEISFPGGKLESFDSDLLATALRETREEIGLSILRHQVIGQLDTVTTLNSRFSITPFIAILDEIPELMINSEVEKIFKIPLKEFLKTMANDIDPSHQSIMEMHTFSFEDKIIWGASARILYKITKRLEV